MKRILSFIIVAVVTVCILASCTIVVPQGGNGGNTNDGGNDGNGGNGGTTDGGNGQTPPDDGGTTDGGNDQTPPDGGTTDGGNDQTPPDGGTTDGGNDQTPPDDGTTDGGNDQTPPDDGNEPDNLIYNGKSELKLICAPGLDEDIISNLQTEIFYYKWENFNMGSEDAEAAKHEIVVGDTSRAITKTAKDRLERIQKNTDDEYSFLIYSDGSSIAIVWDQDDDNILMEQAIAYFMSNCLDEVLIAPRGEIHQETVDLLEYYAAKDAEYINPLWQELEKQHGSEIANALRRYYSTFSSDVVLWVARLYDSDICVCQDYYGEEECSGTKYCGTGGFYYSNSGRDNLGYLPDAESTSQALNFLTSIGLAAQRGGSYKNIITEEMQQQIGDFIYALEEPNGYFYHPQFGIEFTDSKISRRARDLTWCTSILSTFGRTPKYTTANGVRGEDAVGASAPLTGRLFSDRVTAVSKVVAVASDAYAPQLQSLDAFKEYLAGKDIYNGSYGVGNELTAQTPQIQQRDREIGTEDDPTPLMDYLVWWLNDNQNPETGTWDWKKPGDVGYKAYYGTNGLMKISGIYNAHKKPIPNADAAIDSAIKEAMNTEDPATEVVNVYNTWVIISTVLTNIKNYGDGEEEAQKLRDGIMEFAPEAIEVTRQKVTKFIKDDSSAGYTWTTSPANSQGCPVAVPGTVEGDVNGCTITMSGTLGNMLSSLGITRIPMFGERERYLFRKEIANLGPVVKNNDTSVPDIVDFEDDERGEESSYIDTAHNGGKGTSFVVSDPTGADKGNVTEIISYAGKGDSTNIKCMNAVGASNTFVFEADMYLDSATTNYPVQISVGGGYMFTFRISSDGKIELWESSSTTGTLSIDEYLGVTLEQKSWFRVKVEYYYGDEDTVRIKFYCDTDLTDEEDVKLYAVTDNYFDSAGKKLTGSGTPSKSFGNSRIYILESVEAKMYIDNVICYATKLGYTEVTDPNNQPYINIDAPSKDRVTYDFADGELPADITANIKNDSVKVNADNKLSVTGSSDASTLKFPMTVIEKGSECRFVSFKLDCETANTGDQLLSLIAMDYNSNVFGFNVIVLEDEDGQYLTLQTQGNSAGAVISDLRIPLAEEHTLSLAYYRAEGVIIVYLDGEFKGTSTHFYDGANKLIADSFMIKTVGNKSFSLTLDDIIVEKNTSLFANAVAPSVPEKTYDFSTEDNDVVTQGSGTTVSGGTLNMNVLTSAKHSVTLPINNRSNIFNSLLTQLEVRYNKINAEGQAHLLRFADKDGNVIMAFELHTNNGKIDLYEVNANARAKNPIYSYSASDTLNLKFEIFTEEKIVYIYDGGSVKGKSSIFAGEQFIDNGFATFTLESGTVKTNITVDNVRAETAYTVYKDLTVMNEGNPETDLKTGIDFESSSTGSIPNPITTKLNGVNSVTVQNILNGVTEEYSNVFVHSKPQDGNDSITYGTTGISTDSTCIAFEADLCFDFTSSSTVMRLYYGAADRNNTAYYVNVINESGKIVFLEVSTDQGGERNASSINTGVSNGEWFKLRVEYYKGSKDTVRIRTLINGECVAVSDNYSGSHDSAKSPSSIFDNVHFFFMSSGKGTIYVDNVSLSGSNATCTDKVTVTKTYTPPSN